MQREYGEKEITHAHNSLTSSHSGYLPRMTYSLKAWKFYSHLFHQRGCLQLNLIPTQHNTNLHNAACYCTSRYPQHNPKLVIWTAKFFFKKFKIGCKLPKTDRIPFLNPVPPSLTHIHHLYNLFVYRDEYSLKEMAVWKTSSGGPQRMFKNNNKKILFSLGM